LVGRKSRRAHDYHHAKSLVRAGFEPLCAAAGMRDLSLCCEIPFQNSYGRVTSTPRLKSGAIGLRQLATLLPRRDFRPTFFGLFEWGPRMDTNRKTRMDANKISRKGAKGRQQPRMNTDLRG